MGNHKKAIGRVISSIDWRKIKAFHAKLGIKWEYEEDKEIIRRVPSIPELKDELLSIFQYMLEEGLEYISYGSWVVFWERNQCEEIRVIFRLADYSFEDSSVTRESLEESLKRAVEEENYEYAAMIRDEINNQRNDANHNIK